MMPEVDFAELRQRFLQYLPIGAFIGAILLIELVVVLVGWTIGANVQQTIAAPIPPAASLLNIQALGHVLYTCYVYFFLSAGLVLLIPMFFAFGLALSARPH